MPEQNWVNTWDFSSDSTEWTDQQLMDAGWVKQLDGTWYNPLMAHQPDTSQPGWWLFGTGANPAAGTSTDGATGGLLNGVAGAASNIPLVGPLFTKVFWDKFGSVAKVTLGLLGLYILYRIFKLFRK